MRLGLIAVAVLAVSTSAAATTLVPLPGASRVEIVYEPGLERDARRMRETAEDALDRISGDLVDLRVPQTIKVQLVRDASSLAGVAPAGRGAPAYAIGVAYPDLGVISVATRRGAMLSDPVQTLRHELAHIALGTAIGPRAPHWLHEGFAYQHSMEWSWERTETLAGMAWFGGVVPLHELDRTFPGEELPAHRAYAQSYDFVGYLSRRGRWDDRADDGDRWPFRRFLSMIGNGADLDVAARKAYGKALLELFEEWRADLSQRYLLAPIGLFGLALWVLCALLLALAWARKKRQTKRRLGEWEREERAREEAAIARLRELMKSDDEPLPPEGGKLLN